MRGERMVEPVRAVELEPDDAIDLPPVPGERGAVLSMIAAPSAAAVQGDRAAASRAGAFHEIPHASRGTAILAPAGSHPAVLRP